MNKRKLVALCACALSLIVLCCTLLVYADNELAGDMDGNKAVDSRDAILLLRHTLSTDRFPILAKGDVNSDGIVNSNDAIYLLRHTFDSDKYPVPYNRDFTIAVKEDAYVLNQDDEGDKMNANFGADTEIHLKDSDGRLRRYGYVKFDISELKNCADFTCIELDLTLTARQNNVGNPEYAAVAVYGCSAEWSENTLVFADQPDIYGFVSSNNRIPNKKTVHSFAVTDYVRQALEKGETEIAFYIREATEETPLHVRFASKENDSAKAPKLSVYYGTKIDELVYDEHNNDPEISQNGLDNILGQYKVEKQILNVTEDTYVEAGTSKKTNFGSSEDLDFKAYPGAATSYYRIPLLKFDISEMIDENITSATLILDCTTMQDPLLHPKVHVYACDPDEWEESEVTFETKPARGKLLTTKTVTVRGSTYFDILDYMIECQELGKTEISFYLEGDTDSVYRLHFASKEDPDDEAPYISLTYGEGTFSTFVRYEGENPWEVAMENVTAWLDRWGLIKKVGDTNVETVEMLEEEYSLIVDACLSGSTNGYETKYKQYPTRLVSTLKGYTQSTAETALYDEYGGYTGGARYEATGFFYTKKIGDRWWTIDPLGYPFYRVACVLITQGSSTNQKAATLAKYGNAATWAQATTDRMWELGYNSAGGWSDLTNLIKANKPLTQTKIFYAMTNYSKDTGVNISTSGNTELLYGVMPVFDPAFDVSAEESVREAVEQYGDSSDIYGWMSDNELPCSMNMLDNSLNLNIRDPRSVYSYANAWTFLYMRLGKSDITIKDVTDELRKEYRAMVYDKYFSVVTKHLETYAPNHQYLGCRFIGNCYKDESIMRTAGYHCDVISLNYYSVWQGDPTLLADMQRWAGRPFIITEWYAKGMDVWEADNRMTNRSGAGWTVRTQADRGKFYHNYALQLLECKGCVGFDWFQYWDNDPENLNADLSNRNSNKGIMNNSAEEYTILTAAMKELNDQKYNLINFFDGR